MDDHAGEYESKRSAIHARTNETVPSVQGQGQHALFLSAYAAFQKLSIALELVTRDLRHNEEYVAKFGRFWRLAQLGANRVVEALYVHLRTRGLEPEAAPLMKRSLVPERMRCLRQASRRDIRDWVIMRNSMLVTSFYQRLVGIQTRFVQRSRARRQPGS